LDGLPIELPAVLPAADRAMPFSPANGPFSAVASNISASNISAGIDVSFAVPLTHRLRFTADVLGADRQVLLDLLEPSGEHAPRVQFWIDDALAQARPDLIDQLESFLSENADKLRRVSRVQRVAGGESIKNDIHVLERMLKIFNLYDLDRRSYVVVIGGGAVLDTVGFAAAIAHRGLRLVRLPTTTLGQADSGIGVKNGVNLFGKKNWLGAFAAPWGVINDAALLTTLPDREFRCGFAEAVKVSALKDARLFAELCRLAPNIARRESEASLAMIRASAELHLAHITRGGDPFEMNEARPLDFGHWSAHKLEAMTDFELRHGEAVAIGIAIDTIYSSLRHGLPPADAAAVLECLEALGFVLHHPLLAVRDVLFQGLEEFRQHLGGRLTLTMLPSLGRAIDVHEIGRPLMEAAIDRVSEFGRRRERIAVNG
jgi:3-dehydroquinate synthase